MTIFNKLTIKNKVLFITISAIAYLVLFTVSNTYFANKVQSKFKSMENNELYTKDTIQKIIVNIDKMNKLVIVSAISEETTPTVIKQTKEYNNLILKDLNALKNVANEKNMKKLKKYILLIEKRYAPFYKIALNLHLSFKNDFDDGIDEIIGLDAISTKMGKELTELSQFSENNFKTKILIKTT